MAEPIDFDLEKRKRDRAEGLEEDLKSVLDLMLKVVCGDQTVEEMGRWISLNYPKRRRELPTHLRERPPR